MASRRRLEQRFGFASRAVYHHRLRRRPVLEVLEGRDVLSTFTINSLTDTGSGSGLTGDLRYCITQAINDPTSGPEYIQFSIPGNTTIALTGPLPAITRPMTIDGTTETGYKGVPLIDLDATTLKAGQSALLISGGGGGSVIKALAIGNSPGTAISILGNDLGGPVAASGYDNVIAGCYIGTFDGSTAKANLSGIGISSSSGNTIGGTGTNAGNVISGNTVGLTTGDAFTSNNNVVEGNSIGSEAGEEEVADKRLAAVDTPEQRRDALRIA